jgi:hypothetical protein
MKPPSADLQAMGAFEMINWLRDNDPEAFKGYMIELRAQYTHFCVYVHGPNGTTYTHILNLETGEFEQPVGGEDQKGNFVSVIKRKHKLHNADNP